MCHKLIVVNRDPTLVGTIFSPVVFWQLRFPLVPLSKGKWRPCSASPVCVDVRCVIANLTAHFTYLRCDSIILIAINGCAPEKIMMGHPPPQMYVYYVFRSLYGAAQSSMSPGAAERTGSHTPRTILDSPDTNRWRRTLIQRDFYRRARRRRRRRTRPGRPQDGASR